MPKQENLFPFPLIGVLLLALLAGIYLFANKRFSKPKSSDPVAKHTVKTSPNDTLKYWTAEKMRKAKPADLPTTTKVERDK